MIGLSAYRRQGFSVGERCFDGTLFCDKESKKRRALEEWEGQMKTRHQPTI